MAQHLSKPGRARVLYGVIATGVLILLVQLIFVQVFSYSHYLQISEENRIRVLPLSPIRGRISDCEGRLMVSDRPSYAISIIPSEAKDIEQLANQLAPLLEMDAKTIIEKVKKRRFRRHEPVRIKLDVGFKTVCIIEESAELFPGVIYQLEHTRDYHCGDLACHLLGYTGEVDEQESKSSYRIGSMIGRSGIEKQYDALLRGIEGVNYVEIAATGRIIGALEEKQGKDPIPGTELTLTIDLDLQMLADSLFGDTLSGAAIFLKPESGEILVAVSKPTYDANIFSGFVSNVDYSKLIQDERRPLFDRAFGGTYPPGSTTKLLTAGAALQEEIITSATKFSPCFGGYQYGNRYFRCWKPSGHGSLDLLGAIEQSCDTYFYQLGLLIGLETWSKYAKAVGFDQPVGIDLPAEKAGNIPDEEWYNKAYGEGQWTNAVMLNLAIGQGELLATPLALVELFAGIINQGIVMKPHILHSYRTPNGATEYYQPRPARKLPFSQEVCDILMEACLLVVHGEHGTAKWLRLPNMEMGGKTGTAQNPHGKEHSLFVGYAPAKNPKIVGCFIVEQAGHGSTVAAPFVKKVLERYFTKQDISRQQQMAVSNGVD